MQACVSRKLRCCCSVRATGSPLLKTPLMQEPPLDRPATSCWRAVRFRAGTGAPGGWSLRGGRLTLTPPLLHPHCRGRVETRPVEQRFTGEVRLIAPGNPVRRDDPISLTQQQQIWHPALLQKHPFAQAQALSGGRLREEPWKPNNKSDEEFCVVTSSQTPRIWSYPKSRVALRSFPSS